MRLRRRRPARWASTTRSCSSWTLKSPLGNFSKTVPVTSMLSSLLINLPELECGDRRAADPPVHLGTRSLRSHVGGLQTLRAFGDLELYLRALLQAAIALGLDGGEVDEDVLPVLPLDEATTL